MKYTLLLAAIVLIGCTKERPVCECRTVTHFRQWGTNMSQEWERVGEWEVSQRCEEYTTQKTENWLTTTTRVECISR